MFQPSKPLRKRAFLFKKVPGIFWCLVALAWSALAQALPCTVSHPDQFYDQWQKLKQDKCQNEQNISVLSFTKTMDIYLGQPLVLSEGTQPILMTTEPKAEVRFIGVGIRIQRNDITFSHFTIQDSLANGIQIEGNDVTLESLEIANNSLNGVSILKGKDILLIDCEIHHNAQAAVFVHAGAKVKVSQVSFYQNQAGIQSNGPMLPAPIGLVVIPTSDGKLNVSGYIPLSNMETVRYEDLMVEIYVGAQGKKFVGLIEKVNDDGIFQIEIPITADTEVLTALTINDVLNISSAFAEPFSFETDTDIDGDGLANAEDDDPRNPDSDADGLDDGQEKAIGSDPLDPDTDQDCLPDGLEARTTREQIMGLRQQSLGPSRFLQLSESCFAVLQEAGQLPPEDGIYFDLDPETTTNPLQADSDGDGVSDGKEDWNLNGKREETETDATQKDSDQDGLEDGDEKERGTGGVTADTDGDGVFDGDEVHRWQTDPLNCDTDQDGLGDGLEAGVIHVNESKPECRGLPTGGSNFRHPETLKPLQTDSDADGLEDGLEDINHNGWLDPNETDPSVSDSDGDSLSDGLENLLDQNQDGLIDFEINLLPHVEACTPWTDPKDLDCDGFVNAQDLDSDKDGCLDAEEGLSDRNQDGILDIWDKSALACGATNTSSSSTNTDFSQNKDNEPEEILPSEVIPARGGGACWLNPKSKIQNQKEGLGWLIVLAGMLLLRLTLRLFGVGNHGCKDQALKRIKSHRSHWHDRHKR